MSVMQTTPENPSVIRQGKFFYVFERAQWITALALAIPAVALNIVFAFRPDRQIAVPMLIFTILFLVLTLL
jgi:hypothetical protein